MSLSEEGVELGFELRQSNSRLQIVGGCALSQNFHSVPVQLPMPLMQIDSFQQFKEVPFCIKTVRTKTEAVWYVGTANTYVTYSYFKKDPL